MVGKCRAIDPESPKPALKVFWERVRGNPFFSKKGSPEVVVKIMRPVFQFRGLPVSRKSKFLDGPCNRAVTARQIPVLGVLENNGYEAYGFRRVGLGIAPAKRLPVFPLPQSAVIRLVVDHGAAGRKPCRFARFRGIAVPSHVNPVVLHLQHVPAAVFVRVVPPSAFQREFGLRLRIGGASLGTYRPTVCFVVKKRCFLGGIKLDVIEYFNPSFIHTFGPAARMHIKSAFFRTILFCFVK